MLALACFPQTHCCPTQGILALLLGQGFCLDQEGTSAGCVIHSPTAGASRCCTLVCLISPNSRRSVQIGPSAVTLPGPFVICSHLLPLLLVVLEKMGLPWSHLLYQRAKATKIHRGLNSGDQEWRQRRISECEFT